MQNDERDKGASRHLGRRVSKPKITKKLQKICNFKSTKFIGEKCDKGSKEIKDGDRRGWKKAKKYWWSGTIALTIILMDGFKEKV